MMKILKNYSALRKMWDQMKSGEIFNYSLGATWGSASNIQQRVILFAPKFFRTGQ